MNAENFSQYIENPSLLYQMNYEELRQLVLQYPFNSNLRYLLVKKNQQEDHRDFERNLKTAAINSPDRTQLYKMLHSENIIVDVEEEERLELKSLQELDLQEETVVTFAPVEEPIAFNNDEALNIEIYEEPTSIEEDIKLNNNVTSNPFPELNVELEDITENPISIPVEANEEALLNHEKELIMKNLTPIPQTELTELTPIARRSFSKWRNRYQKPRLLETERYDPRSLQIVHQSVEESDEIVTETYAEILTNQQQFEKAIEVYQRLTLLFPEKSDFFADRIKNIEAQMK